MASIEQNTALPIYNADGTRFHDLELKKVVVDSVVMSLSDKITGEVCYKDNTLGFTMQEYVKYRRNEDEDYTKYFLVNPPTLVREGMVSDNSDLKGMTRYSFEFYHPMYMLGNFPFTDVAVSSDEKKYLSESKEFSWIGKPADYVAKLNKNLEGTEWVVVLSSRFPEGTANQLSEVLKFDKNTIADALKTGYDTWGVPFVIDNLREGEYYNSNHVDYYSVSGGSKRYVVIFGLPSNDILVEDNGNQVPFVFQFGKGVGLKNNSRNPRNNKIITRIAGYGSEQNVPFGYPQIQWYGDSRWEFTEYEGSTINYDNEGKVTNTPKAGAYPLYKGIVGGTYVTLIHHPFTRSHLMPSIYSQSVFNKVSPYLSNGNANPDYNPDLQLVDYYDAITDSEFTYINEINSGAPSYEIHEFDVKPELRDGEDKTITSAVPLNGDLTEADSWNDNMDEDGNFEQSYFKVTLPALGFDIYACASITEEMQINMRSGACIGCTFNVQVDWDDYKNNFYDSDGNFDPVIGEGHPRNATKYPDSTSSAISLILQKENSTFGTLMPNIYQHPASGDAFVILGISLPLSYITNAELRLDMEMKSFMLENNVHYYDYPLKFDEHFLTTHENILKQITTNSIIRFGFEGEEEPLELFVKQLTVKYGEGVLPKYDITLTDNVEVVLNQIGKVADSVEKLGAIVAILRQTYNRSVWSELDKKLSKNRDDYTPYKLRMHKSEVDTEARVGESLVFGPENTEHEKAYIQNVKGCKIYWNGSGWEIETDYLSVNKRMYAKSIQVNEVTHVGGENLLTEAACVADIVKTYSTFYRVFFRKKNGEGRTIFNSFRQGDQAYCQIFNIDAGLTHDFTNRYYWRMVVNTSNDTGTYDAETRALMEDYHFIDLSIDIADASGDIRMDDAATSIPLPEDPIIQLGYRPSYDHSANPLTGNDILERQGATLISGGGKWKRSIVMWEEIKTFHLPEPKIKISPNEVNLVVDSLKIRTSGSGGSSQDQPIEDFVDENQSQFLIFETETTAIPTLSNAPYTSWSAAEKELYSTEPNNAVVLNADGRTWRFVKSGNTYAFEEFTDPWLLAQHIKIENILDDGVITADEIIELRNIKARIETELTQITSDFNNLSDTAQDALEEIFNDYDVAAKDVVGGTKASGTTVVGCIGEVLACTPPVKLKESPSAASGTYDINYTRDSFRSKFTAYSTALINWQNGIRNYMDEHLATEIEQILEDDVITANEIPQMQLTCNEIIAQYTKANTEYTGMPTPRGQAIVSIFSSLTTYYNTLCSNETGNTGYFYDFSLMTPPIFLKKGSEPNRYRASRSDILQAIYNFNLKLEEWNKAYASYSAHADVLDVISNLTQYTIDQSLQNLLDDYEELVESGTYSSLQALDEGLEAVTNWVGTDSTTFGTTGLITHLNTLFVGTGTITLQKDGNGNVMYFDSSDRRILEDSTGIYWLDESVTPSVKHYYKDTDPSADGKHPNEYGKPKVDNINKAGLVTSTNFASLFVNNMNANNLITEAAALAMNSNSITMFVETLKGKTGIDVEEGKIDLNAENVNVNGELGITDPSSGFVLYDENGIPSAKITNEEIGDYDDFNTVDQLFYKYANFYGYGTFNNTSEKVDVGTRTSGSSLSVVNPSFVAAYGAGGEVYWPTQQTVSLVVRLYKNGVNDPIASQTVTCTRDASARYTHTGTLIFNILSDGSYSIEFSITGVSDTVPSGVEVLTNLYCGVLFTSSRLTRIGVDGFVSNPKAGTAMWSNTDMQLLKHGANGIRVLDNGGLNNSRGVQVLSGITEGQFKWYNYHSIHQVKHLYATDWVKDTVYYNGQAVANQYKYKINVDDGYSCYMVSPPNDIEGNNLTTVYIELPTTNGLMDGWMVKIIKIKTQRDFNLRVVTNNGRELMQDGNLNTTNGCELSLVPAMCDIMYIGFITWDINTSPTTYLSWRMMQDTNSI